MGEDTIRSAELLSRLLRYGDAATRRRLSNDVAAGDRDLAMLLAQTARSDEDPELRMRCLEVLGRALETADRALGLAVLIALFGPLASETVLGL
jgi:hypothetical protein